MNANETTHAIFLSQYFKNLSKPLQQLYNLNTVRSCTWSSTSDLRHRYYHWKVQHYTKKWKKRISNPKELWKTFDSAFSNKKAAKENNSIFVNIFPSTQKTSKPCIQMTIGKGISEEWENYLWVNFSFSMGLKQINSCREQKFITDAQFLLDFTETIFSFLSVEMKGSWHLLKWQTC